MKTNRSKKDDEEELDSVEEVKRRGEELRVWVEREWKVELKRRKERKRERQEDKGGG